MTAKNISLPLTEREAEYLKDILELWIEGHDEARVQTAQAPYDNEDQMLTMLAGLDAQFQDATVLKFRLCMELEDE